MASRTGDILMGSVPNADTRHRKQNYSPRILFPVRHSEKEFSPNDGVWLVLLLGSLMRGEEGLFPGQVIYNCPLPNTDHLGNRVAVTATNRVTMLNRSKLPIDLAPTYPAAGRNLLP